MRVLSVSPRGADAVGSLLRGNGGGGKHVRKGGGEVLIVILKTCRLKKRYIKGRHATACLP